MCKTKKCSIKVTLGNSKTYRDSLIGISHHGNQHVNGDNN